MTNFINDSFTKIVLAGLLNFICSISFAATSVEDINKRLFWTKQPQVNPNSCESQLAPKEIGINEKIKSFYGEEDPEFYIEGLPRFFDQFLNQFVQPVGNALTPKVQQNVKGIAIVENRHISIPVSDNGDSVTAFHRLSFEDHWINYAATNGVSILQVKVQRAPHPGEKQESVEHILDREFEVMNYLNQIGFPTSSTYGRYIDLSTNKTIIMREYVPGPSLAELENMFKKNKIDQATFDIAKEKFEKFLSQFEEIQKTKEFKTLLSKFHIEGQIPVSNQNIVYSNGEWKLIGI